MKSEREIDAIVEQAERAERERCAKIADAIADKPCDQSGKVPNWCAGKRYGAQEVAAAIRNSA